MVKTNVRNPGASDLFRIIPFCTFGVLAGCFGPPERTEYHREWFIQEALFKDLSLRIGDSLSTHSNATTSTVFVERGLDSLADTSEVWNLDTAGLWIEIPSLEGFRAHSFQIRSHRTPAPGDTIHLADGSEPDTNPPKVTIMRLETHGGAPFLISVRPESLSLVLEGIPFDTAFAPPMPEHGRVMARKAARFRLEFDGWIVQGESHIVEYRYAETIHEIEYNGL